MPGAPSVSIGMPVYNGQNYVAEAVRSVLEQSMTDFELIICDNCSTDATLRVCRQFARLDGRVRVVDADQNRGAAWNFNRSVDEARGRLFKWASHDDLLSPHYLHYTFEVLEQRPDVVACHCETAAIDAEGRTVGLYAGQPSFEQDRASDRFRSAIIEPHRCLMVFGLVRTDALRSTPMIGAYTGSDRNLIAEWCLHGKVAHHSKTLMGRRDHPQASIRAHQDERARAAWFDPTLADKPVYPTWRRLTEYRASVSRSPISVSERARCRWHLLAWLGARHQAGGRMATRIMRDWRRARRRPGPPPGQPAEA
ncbi:MAG: glycosyltransferase family A protein [Planctomycetota bacterium]